MEAYYEFQIRCNEETRDSLIAELAEEGFEGFMENEEGFSAFIPQSLFSQEIFDTILMQYSINPDSVPQNTIQQQNWNAQWEASFQPITIGNDIIVKAPFHLVDDHYTYELVIQPKNTFGTGHHETTQLMLQMMLPLELKDKKVFDYGCGTGVLSVMASLLGAESIYAIDIDEWSAENIGENTALNGVRNITFERGDLSVVKDRTFDIVLANINKNILLMSFRRIAEMMNKNGLLLISGFYESDLEDLKREAQNHHLIMKDYLTKNEWCAAQFKLL